MSIYIPYFYIIQHISSGKYYAGSKFSKNTNPDNFMQFRGYITSSNKIKNIIKSEGLDSFVIRKIKPFKLGADAYNYESKFLKKVDAKNNIKFFNGHNNTLLCTGTPEYTNMMMKLYNVTHNSHLPEVVSRRVFTTKNRPEVDKKKSDEKKLQSCIKTYGTEYASQNIEVKLKSKNTILEKYDGIHFANLNETKDKKINTCMSNFGVEYPFQSEVIREKSRKTTLERYGVNHASQSEEFKLNKKETNIRIRGVEYPMQCEDVKLKCKNTMEERYGYSSNFLRLSQIIRTCPHCNLVGKGNNMLRYHFDNCKLINTIPK